MHGSSAPMLLYPQPLGWQSAPPTSGVCPTGRPTIPATGHSSLLMTLAGNPTYPSCPGWLWASPGNAPTPALVQAEGLSHLPPDALWSSALGVQSGASHLRMPLPWVCKRSHICPVIYPKSNCSCSNVSIWHHLLPGSTSQYSTPACGWPPMPAGVPP